MKLILLRNNLLEGLFSTERVINDNVNLPILKNILLKANNSKITITATNLNLAINHNISGKIVESGEVTVPHNILNNIIKNLNTEKVSLEKKNKQLNIITDNYEAVIEGQESKDFPIIPLIQNQKQHLKIDVSVFKSSLQNVINSTQFSDIRPEISGIFLQLYEDGLKLVATDSFRLAEKKLNTNLFESNIKENAVIIPLKTAQELLRVLKENDQKLWIFIEPNQILFKTDSLEITSHLIDGRFPDYEPIIPKTLIGEATLDRNELINAVKLTSVFSGRINDLILKTGENKKFLEIYSASSMTGENRYKIPIKLKGDKFSVVFNWHYLLEGLKIFNGEEIILGVNAHDKPALIKDQNQTDLIYVLMPIKV
ncbi:MAG: DNA polymerase III subunit beta [Patescibacteria group bacterium]